MAELLRPTTLTGFVGQHHLTDKTGIISALLTSYTKSGFFPSLILWGPPGCGKTTLARIIAAQLGREFVEYSAVQASIKEIQAFIKDNNGYIVFLDEIHRFNKAQQDRLLPHVEKGTITLIGATTENPSFEVIGPLLSRCRVITLHQLTEEDLSSLIDSAQKYLGVRLSDQARQFLTESSNGDARVLLNVIEIAHNLAPKKKALDISEVETALQRRQLSFDKMGDEFYNTISSYLKSMRAGDVDASLYYLARMVSAGQDPLYIARRMVVFASEDVASPTALVVANAVFQACQQIGYPECQENLAAGTVYLATAKKDRSAYDAYMRALEDVKKFGNLPIPLQIRNAPTKLMKELGYGKGYEPYTKESLLPEKIKGKKYYIQSTKND